MCVADILATLASAVKPVLCSGARIRKAEAKEAFHAFAEAWGAAWACMPNGKGMVDEEWDKNFIGTYWGGVSSPFCCETVESAGTTQIESNPSTSPS